MVKRTGRRRDKLGLIELVAMGVGGMIGGGIFSVMGLAAGITGRATPLAFALGGALAMLAGYSYIRLALAYRSDGASFTYMERAFPRFPIIGIITGWTVVTGYIGTLALYAFTFGAYGSELAGKAEMGPLRQTLSLGILIAFMAINLRGTGSSGRWEDVIVYLKIGLLGVLALAALPGVERNNLSPLVDHGMVSVFMAAAMIFVAYEGFQLITNAVCETDDPGRNIPRAIALSITVVVMIYVGLSVVAIGSISVDQLIVAKEYALAVAVEPQLGETGRTLVSLAALLATSSAINATLFGASRMMAEMASNHAAPRAFSFRSRVGVPWIAIAVITAFSVGLTVLGGLQLIAAFSSMTFLLVSLAISIANFRLREVTRSNSAVILAGVVLIIATISVMISYLLADAVTDLLWIGLIYVSVAAIVLIHGSFRAGHV
jgi:amino acid transporter